MAKPELGGKRQCHNCATKFFDLNRDPIVCPKCGTVFVVAANARMAARAVVDDEEGEIDTAAANLVPISEVDVVDDKVAAAATDDIEIEDDEPADTFLEEEEEDGDDVATLIDGDIESDEEA